jgi:two-component system nitrogen regulation response regulator NtrX
VPGRKFSAEAVKRLQTRTWLGNIRELRNAVERALILAPGKVVTGEDIDNLLPFAPVVPGTSLENYKEEAEKNFLLQKLKEHNWNITETARDVKMPRSNLYRKIQRYRFSRESE